MKFFQIINKLLCSNCKKKTLKENNEEIICEKCKQKYGSILIPSFIEKTYTSSFGFQWNRFNKTQLDSYNKLSLTKDRFFRTTRWKQNLIGNLILEVGSGSGRFTEILAQTKGSIVTLDSSTAIRANFSNNSSYQNVKFIRADINNMPFDFQFDKVLCLGVLQHTNDVKNTLKNLKKFLKPGGEMVFDVYKKNWHTYFQWKYLLRPLLKKVKKEILLKVINYLSNFFYYPSLLIFKIFGKIYKRIFPVIYYHEIIKEKKLSIEFSVLDSFDMYSPVFDNPLSIIELDHMLLVLGFKIIFLDYGDNGIIGKVSC